MSFAEEEVGRYHAEEEIDKNQDPLILTNFERVALLACRVVCLPATSVPSERLFSSAGNIKNRLCLKLENVDCLCYLSENL